MAKLFYTAEVGDYAPNFKHFLALANLDAFMVSGGWTKICDPNPSENSKGEWERTNDNIFGLPKREVAYVAYSHLEDVE